MRKFSLLHLSQMGGKRWFLPGVLLIALLSTAACTVSLPQAPKPLAACTVTAANLNFTAGPAGSEPFQRRYADVTPLATPPPRRSRR